MDLFNGNIFYSFLGFCAFIDETAEGLTGNSGESERERERERGDDMQQRATGWNRTRGRHSEDTASVYGAPSETVFL